jgi:predicted flavoprotein YhiN
MDEVFTIIGRLYVDAYNSQKVIELLQQQLKEKNTEIEELTRAQVQDE